MSQKMAEVAKYRKMWQNMAENGKIYQNIEKYSKLLPITMKKGKFLYPILSYYPMIKL
jgi:hypothetical protein